MAEARCAACCSTTTTTRRAPADDARCQVSRGRRSNGQRDSRATRRRQESHAAHDRRDNASFYRREVQPHRGKQGQADRALANRFYDALWLFLAPCDESKAKVDRRAAACRASLFRSSGASSCSSRSTWSASRRRGDQKLCFLLYISVRLTRAVRRRRRTTALRRRNVGTSIRCRSTSTLTHATRTTPLAAMPCTSSHATATTRTLVSGPSSWRSISAAGPSCSRRSSSSFAAPARG